MNNVLKNSPQVKETVLAIPPRLLDINEAAAYLGISSWTARSLADNGTLRRVRIPLPHNGELRKVLFDRNDLDALIDAWKEQLPLP